MNILEEVKTVFNDLQGEISVDFEGAQDDFREYARQAGLDTDIYKPVGVKIFGGSEKTEVHLIVRKRSEVGDSKTDVFPTGQTIQDFFSYVKRIKILLRTTKPS